MESRVCVPVTVDAVVPKKHTVDPATDIEPVPSEASVQLAPTVISPLNVKIPLGLLIVTGGRGHWTAYDDP